MKKFKRCVCQHWLELARVAATSMISEAIPMLLLTREDSGRSFHRPHMTLGVFPGNMDSFQLAFIGDSFPDNSHPRLKTFLNLWDVHPADLYRIAVQWQVVSHAILGSLKKRDEEPRNPMSLQHCTGGSLSDGPGAALVLSRCRSRAHQRGLHHGPAWVQMLAAACLQAEDPEVSECAGFEDSDGFICLLAMQITEEH
jgi:hypothetical protein